MTSPVWLTGFEHGVATPTTNGGGLFNTVTGSPSIQSTTKNTGSYALRLNPSSAIYTVFKNLSSPTVVVGRLYFRFASWAGVDNEIVYVTVAAGVNLAIKINATTKKLFARFWSTSSGSDHATTLALDTWYRLDFRFDVSTGTSKIDFQVDGVAATQFTLSQSATTFSSIGLGPSNSDTMDLFIDDVVVSVTSGDYPIGAGGTEALSPASDGTHNAGTNVMENNAGTDIGVTTAYDKLNSIPPSSTTYVRQAAVGTGNYAEVLFGDIAATHSAIIGAMGILAYTSATTTANQGATIMSKDSFSSQTDIWGNPTTRADMSDGSTANLYYKSALLAGVVDDTTVNALKARVGYSNDVSPNPYWIDLIVEVAYTVSTGLSATVNQTTETDTAQAVGKKKQKAIGQNAETDTAQAVTRVKRLAVAQNTETDTAQAFTRVKIKAIGQVTETDTAQAITRVITVILNQVAETDAAQAITAVKIKGVAQVTESDAAQAVTRIKQLAVAQVTETDAAQAITARKVVSVGQVTEADEAQAITRVKALAINQVSETDAAQAFTRVKIKAIGQVTETDTAQAFTRVKIKAIGQVTETDTAQPFSSQAGIAVGQVEETDTAQAFTRVKIKTIGQVTEADEAQPVRALKIVVIQQVVETDLAQALFPQKRVAIAQIVEIDLAQAFGRSKVGVVGQAVETDLAQAITAAGGANVFLGIAQLSTSLVDTATLSDVNAWSAVLSDLAREAATVGDASLWTATLIDQAYENATLEDDPL